MSKKIFLLFVLVFGVFGLVSSQELVNYSEHFDVEVLGEGLFFEEVEDGGGEFVFQNKDAKLIIDGNVFENIVGIDEEFDWDDELEQSIDINRSGRISDADFLVDENGGSYDINELLFDVLPETLVHYEILKGVKGGLSFEFKDGTNLEKFSDFVWEYPIEISGENLELPNGNVLNEGHLIYQDGEYYLEGSTAIINNIKVKSTDKINVFFEDGEFGDKGIFFGKENLYVSGLDEYNFLNLKFLKNNSYIDIEDSDKFSLDLYEGSIELIGNRKSGLIPSLNTFGDIDISQDSKKLVSSNGRVFLENSDFATSSPMDISFFDNDGKPVFVMGDESFGKLDGFAGNPTGSEHKVLVDNFNRFAIIPENSGEEFYVESEGIDTKFSQRLSYNYVGADELNVLTHGKIKYIDESGEHLDSGLTQGEESFTLGRMRDYWNNLNEDTKKTIDNIHLMSDKVFYETRGDDDWAAFYHSSDNGIYFNIEYFDLDTFRHESAHARHYYLMDNSYERNLNIAEDMLGVKYKDLVLREKELSSEYNSMIKEIDTIQEVQNYKKIEELAEKKKDLAEVRVVIDDFKNFVFNSRFDMEKEWNEIAMIDYVGEDWNKWNSNPVEGLVWSYGRMNYEEDIATYVQKINQPEFFKSLINPESGLYDERYRKKLDYLHRYKFITDKEYNRVLEVAGV